MERNKNQLSRNLLEKPVILELKINTKSESGYIKGHIVSNVLSSDVRRLDPILPPIALSADLIECLLDSPPLTRALIPLIEAKIPAGFPSPADDYTAARLDLNCKFLGNPTACFFARASGQSMIGAGIFDGDYLLIDRSVEPRHNDIVVAVIAGEFTVKRLYRQKGRCALIPENPEFLDIEISPESDDSWIWGVVTSVHRSVRDR